MSKPHRGAIGPDDGGRYALRVVTVPVSTKLTVRLLADVGPGVICHWQRGRSVYCPGEGRCDPKIHRGPWNWQTFVASLLWDEEAKRWYPAVLRVTQALDHEFRGRGLRGTEWVLFRPPGPKDVAGPVSARLQQTLHADDLPEAFPIAGCLLSTFNVPKLPLATKNPSPPPELVQGVDMIGPLADQLGKEFKPAGKEEVRRMIDTFRARAGVNGRAKA